MIVALEGKALCWFQWWEPCHQEATWIEFKNAILERFQSSGSLSPFAALLALKQEGGVADFVEQFERHAGMMRGVEEEHLRDLFLNGLKEDIAAEVKLYEPKTLTELVKKMLMVEQKNSAVQKVGSGGLGGRTSSNFQSFPSTRSVMVETIHKNMIRSSIPLPTTSAVEMGWLGPSLMVLED